MVSSSPDVVSRSRRSAFTLVELLVVVAIISLLLSILLPALNRARDLATAAVCSSNLNQLFKAQLFYASDYNDSVVPDGIEYRDAAQTNPNPWYPSWPSEEHGLGSYVPFKENEEGMRSADVFRCPTYVAEVKPRAQADGGSARRRNDFTYSLNYWTSTGHRYSAMPPFNRIMDRVGPGGDIDDYMPTAKLGKFPRPAATAWAMDGAPMDMFSEFGGWGTAQVAGPSSEPYGNDDERLATETEHTGADFARPYLFLKKHRPNSGPSGNEFGTQPWEGHGGGAEYVFLDGHVSFRQEDLPISNAAEESYYGGGRSATFWLMGQRSNRW